VHTGTPGVHTGASDVPVRVSRYAQVPGEQTQPVEQLVAPAVVHLGSGDEISRLYVIRNGSQTSIWWWWSAGWSGIKKTKKNLGRRGGGGGGSGVANRSAFRSWR